MEKIVKYTLYALFASVFFVSCQKEYFAPVAVEVSDSAFFKKDIIPIFTTNCMGSGCHSGTISPNLSETNAYESLTSAALVDTLEPEKSVIYVKITSNMPPTGKLSPDKINKILLWIKQGALNN